MEITYSLNTAVYTLVPLYRVHPTAAPGSAQRKNK